MWSPENPKLYTVVVQSGKEELKEKIRFRKIETSGKDILLNGKPVLLRGICIHEEIPEDMRRAHSKEDALKLLGWAKDLNANMVRLTHYPHNENMTKMADSLGLMVWSEIPVYWALNFESDKVRLPLGVLGDYNFQSKKLQLNKGDKLLLFTDGVIEAFNEEDAEFGEERFKSFLKKNINTTVGSIVKNSLTEVNDFAGNAPQWDDITLMGITYTG